MNEKRQVSGTDEELIDILTAISVVSKRLARNLTNHLRFVFNDGSTVERTWADRSRRESWTPEMKQAAAERTRIQRRKKQCQE